MDFVKRLKEINLSVGIGEASHITGASLTQIRYWEKKALIESFQREAGGNKRFTFPNLAKIVLIKSLIDEGYTLAKAAELLAAHRHQADRVKVIANALVEVEDGPEESIFHFGQIANDPNYDIIARVTDSKTTFCKVKHEA